MVQVENIIDSERESDEGSNYNMEDSYFVDDDEDITNLYDEEDERNFMGKYLIWESFMEVIDDE